MSDAAKAESRASLALTRSAESWLTQVYAASIMFGYFVRRVDKRFQLERSLGLLPQNQEEAVARLERLFSQVPLPPSHHAAHKDHHPSWKLMYCPLSSECRLLPRHPCSPSADMPGRGRRLAQSESFSAAQQAETLDGADDPDSPASSAPSSAEASASPSQAHGNDGAAFSQAQATGDFQALGAEQAKKKRIPLRE